MAEPIKPVEQNPLSPVQEPVAPPVTPVVAPTAAVTPPAEPTPSTAKTPEPFPDFSEFLPAELSTIVKEPVVTPAVTPVAPVVTPAPVVEETRDYNDLPPDYVPHFKKMGNEAFKTLKPILLKAKQLETQIAEREAKIAEMQQNRLPENYYENEKAFLLTPEFTEAATGVQRAQTIQQHWENQLTRIREGEEIQNLSVNEKGEMQLSAPIKVTPQIESQVISLLTQAQQEVAKHNGVLHSLATQHKTRHSEVKNWVTDFDKKSFAVFEKPENESLRKIVADTVSSFHPSLRANPLAPILAKAMVTVMSLGNMLKQQQTVAAAPTATVNGKPVDPKDLRAAGPTATGIAGGGTPAKKEVTFDDFERVIQGVPNV